MDEFDQKVELIVSQFDAYQGLKLRKLLDKHLRPFFQSPAPKVEDLSDVPDDILRELKEAVDSELLDRASQTLFNATPEELGEAAVKGAREELLAKLAERDRDAVHAYAVQISDELKGKK